MTLYTTALTINQPWDFNDLLTRFRLIPVLENTNNNKNKNIK
jgi:hypothetical protein